MDAKRGNNAPATRHAVHASRTSVASRHGQQAAPAGGQVATMSRKHASEASLTPSQAKRDTENPRKSPLDALSRAGATRQQDPFARRSGLQDVDDAFLATNAFARPSRVRHSGLDGWTDGGAAAPPAGTAAVAPIRMSGGQEQSQVLYQQPQQGMPSQAAAPTQEQQQMPPPQQQSPPVAAVPSQQQFMQQPAAGQPTRHEPYPTGRAHVHHNQQQQQQQVAHDQQQQQQQMAQQETQSMNQSHPQGQLSPRKYQQQSQGFPSQPNAGGGERAAAGGSANGGQQPQVGGGAAPPPEAELCTTCPNCQTTIYLVRSAEMGHGDNAAPTQ
ncbi:probable serine/threonine-protein kinase samkC [Drosophila obscura]|uniref:probable serine/threonine-protein kinase samkC n=1 Tax=Drosophila obscura TaxID=7282 RepID=UPI000BA0B3F0|nr:probable serine/threonine-protein kinase samkC [Drosophila obscura]